MTTLYISIFILYILTLPSVKGMIGELSVMLKLRRLNSKKYIVLNDVLIPSHNGKTSQIDHIIVSIYGIFVVETKNYRGWIFGSENGYNWTQVIYKTKTKFLNPIIQNKGHIKALKHLLDEEYPELPFIPIVTFSFQADFKKLDVQTHVIYSLHLLRVIRRYKERVLAEQDMQAIAERIQAANIKGAKARREHVRNIKKSLQPKPVQPVVVAAKKPKLEPIMEKVSAPESPEVPASPAATEQLGEMCPRCGHSLVVRKGSRGLFVGCSSFPACRYTAKIPDQLPQESPQ